MNISLNQLQLTEQDLSESEALKYYLQFVDDHNEVIQRRLYDKLQKQERLRAVMGDMPFSEMLAMSEYSQGVLWRAYHSGNWSEYRAYLSEQGSTYAKIGLELSDWITIITIHRKCLLHICKNYNSKIDLLALWEGSTHLGDYALEVISTSYLERLASTIESKHQEGERSKFALKEATLKNQQILERFRLAADSSSAGIWDWDLVTNEVYYSDRFKDLLGYKPEEWPHTFDAFKNALHPEDEARTLKKVNDSLSSSEPYDISYRLRLKSGEYRWFWARGKVLRRSSGEPFRMAGSISDIHKRVQAEKELENLNKNLEKKVEERTAKLQAINEELESFSYTVSHDLRAPLRAVSGYSKFLIKRSDDNLNEEQLRFINIIEENIQRMGNLIDDLLLYSRLGRAKLHRVKVDMKTLVDEVLSELVEEDRILSIEVSDIHPAKVDRTLIKSVWSNLIDNAIKYSAHLEKPMIKIGSNQLNNQIEYWVKDDGAGFDMRYKSKLYGMFQRLHADEEFEGTGVGLAIVKRLVMKHGGRVRAEGEINKGATFYFTIPNSTK